MEVELIDETVQIQNDDGFNPNVVSCDFVRDPHKPFTIFKSSVSLMNSTKQSVGDSLEIIIEGTHCIGTYEYVSNWVLETCRYDVHLGMPWHVGKSPTIEYSRWVSKEDNDVLLLSSSESKKTCIVHVKNIGVKKFRNLLKIKCTGNYIELYKVVQMNTLNVNNKKICKSVYMMNT